MDDCIFCKIIKGEIPSRKVYEDASTFAFLDINPANPGHTLVVSKKHYAELVDITDTDLKDVIINIKKIAKNLKDNMGAQGLNLLQNNGKMAGQIVHHIHFHVIPRFPNDSIMLALPRKNITDQEMDEIQKKMTVQEKKNPQLDWDY